MSNKHEFSQVHADAIEEMKRQLLIVFVKRLGGKVEVPVSEVDDTGQDLLAMNLDAVSRVFTFEVLKKQ